MSECGMRDDLHERFERAAEGVAFHAGTQWKHIQAIADDRLEKEEELTRLREEVKGLHKGKIEEAPRDGTVIEFRDGKGLCIGMGYWENNRWNRIGCRSRIFGFAEILEAAEMFTIYPFPALLKKEG